MRYRDQMIRDPEIPDLVDLTEAAATLGISRQAMHKRAAKGNPPGAQVGGGWVFRRVMVESAAAAKKADEAGNP